MKKLTSFISIVAIFLMTVVYPSVAMAASLTTMSDTLSDATASSLSNHTITFTTPTGVASGATIILTFDNSTSIAAGLTFADIDLTDDGVDLPLAATPAGATWGVVRTSATVITFTNGTTAVAAGSVISIQIGTNATFGTTGTEQITNGLSGTTTLTFSGTFGDTGVLSMAIVPNAVVAINAEVLATLSFTISDNTIYYGRLSASNVCFAQGTDPGPVTCPTTTEAESFNMTAATNGTNGYSISVQGATLTSGANTITAIGGTNTASTPGTEQFGMRLTATGGSGTVSSPYAASGYAYAADTTTPDVVATSAIATTTTTYSVRYMANITNITEAGMYDTSHTYVVTGNF